MLWRLRGRVQRTAQYAAKNHLLEKILEISARGYILLGGIIGIIALFLELPGLQITHIEVVGNRMVDTKQIQVIVEQAMKDRAFFVVRRDTPLSLPIEKILSGVYASDHHIRSVNINRTFSRTLQIETLEEEPVFLWCGNETPTSTPVFFAECWFTNRDGRIYAKAPSYTVPPFPVFFTTPSFSFSDRYPRENEYPLGYMIADEFTIERLGSLRDALAERGYQAGIISIDDYADITVHSKDGMIIRLNLAQDLSEVMDRFDALVRSWGDDSDIPHESIDLRFSGKIFYK